MTDFSKRSYKKELLDGDNIPFQDIHQNMKELNFINTHLGGHSITLKGFKKLVGKKSRITICEIGCGGGDNLNAIYNFARKIKVDIKTVGIDINNNCIRFAKENSPNKNSHFITSDYKIVDFANSKPDIIFSSLFCHHFNDEELVSMIRWMKANSLLGFFINDLHRHFLAFHFIKFLTSLFSKSYLVKNDAPLSVLRGFKKKEWENIFTNASISNYSLNWKWAFRYLIIAPSFPNGK